MMPSRSISSGLFASAASASISCATRSRISAFTAESFTPVEIALSFLIRSWRLSGARRVVSMNRSAGA